LKKNNKKEESIFKTISKNRKARHNYEVIETLEVGIELTGTEVKALRAGKANLADSYAVIKKGQVWLQNCHISHYDQGNIFNHQPMRIRRLLLHKNQILNFQQKVDRQQLTLVPLSIYFKKQWVKIELGLCKGRKDYDKRQKLMSDQNKRHLAAVMKNR
jgi:SsrA-binding protein